MGNGYIVPPTGDYGVLYQIIEDLKVRIEELERPTGSQVAQALKKLQELVAGLITQVNGIFSGYVQANGNITSVSGAGTFPAGINSIGVYNLDVSGLAGARRTEWVHVSGALGYAPSTVEKKTDVDGYGATSKQFLACMPIVFHYIGQLDIRDNPSNPNYDPDYDVPLEVGHLAELLVANGLGEFVFRNEDGSPAGINMAEFAAVGFVIVGRDHEARLRALEATASAS